MVKILAIDNIQHNLNLFKIILKKHIPEAKTLTAQSAVEGIKLAELEQPDTIILDLRMPRIDGFEACKILKTNPKTSHIPIIICTAINNDTESIIKGLSLGADAFISKPIAARELLSQVKVMLRIKKAEDNLKKEILKYKVIADTIPDALVTVDINGKITFASYSTVEIFGYNNTSELIGKIVFNLIDYKYLSKAQKVSEIILHGKTIKDIEFEFKKNNGNTFHGELSSSLIKNKNNDHNEILIIIKDISDRKTIEIEKLKYQKKLKSLNIKLMNIEEDERRKIAINLHEVLGQTLSIAHINLTSLINSNLPLKIQKIIDESSALIHNAINESRSLTYDLSPPILFELGLIAAIRWKLEQIKTKHNLNYEYFVNETEPITNANDLLLYRIISELLHNIIKHAKASKIIFKIEGNQNRLFIQIIDDGIGFLYENNSSNAKNMGFGIFSIIERLESINGNIEYDSKYKSGTQINIIIPN